MTFLAQYSFARDTSAGKGAEDQFSGMTLHSRHRKVRDLGVGNGQLGIDMYRQITETCSQDETNFGLEISTLTQKIEGLLKLFVQCHTWLFGFSRKIQIWGLLAPQTQPEAHR